MKRIFWAVALCAVWNGGATQAQNEPLLAENRWVVAIDATDASELNEKTEEARAEFYEELYASGIPEDHVFTFATNATDEARRPTRENIEAVLDALRDVSGRVRLDPAGAEPRRWRGDDENAPCEAMIFITAAGVAVEENGRTRNFIVPCDASLSKIAGAEDERLIDVAAIEEALTNPEDGSRPIDRVFLAINFRSSAATRNADVASKWRGVELKKVGARGVRNEESASWQGFSFVRVLTKNERLDDFSVDAFYQTTTQGLRGYADVAGNGDGWVGALELAEYVRDNGRVGAVDLVFNGSAPYSVARARRQTKIPATIFEELEQTFTLPENQALKESARKRKTRAAERTPNVGVATDGDENAATGSRGTETRDGKEGGVLR